MFPHRAKRVKPSTWSEFEVNAFVRFFYQNKLTFLGCFQGQKLKSSEKVNEKCTKKSFKDHFFDFAGK